ncbi:MAG: hypothetical protein N3I86_10765 [Verrucomicrobiae bacterium]|nr:hypothetical protein [Verrucomicrobiae bacterium]MDW8310482.1 hypothetical protein [Verrucomicrobiales bacterium]
MNSVNDVGKMVWTIRGSLLVFALGVASLLPLVGLATGLVTLGLWGLVRGYWKAWNPAQRYLDWGARLALCGILLSLLLGGLLVWGTGMSPVELVGGGGGSCCGGVSIPAVVE